MYELGPCSRCKQYGKFIMENGMCHTCCGVKEPDWASSCISFTGHREFKNPHPDLQQHLVNIVYRAGNRGFWGAITGGAIGFDWMAHKAVVSAIKIGDMDNHLQANILARPFSTYGLHWPQNIFREFMDDIFHNSTYIIDVYPDGYAPFKLFGRNRWMVDHSSVVVAGWDGRRSGGTFSCIRYALETGRAVLHLDPTTLEERWLAPGTQLIHAPVSIFDSYK